MVWIVKEKQNGKTETFEVATVIVFTFLCLRVHCFSFLTETLQCSLKYSSSLVCLIGFISNLENASLWYSCCCHKTNGGEKKGQASYRRPLATDTVTSLSFTFETWRADFRSNYRKSLKQRHRPWNPGDVNVLSQGVKNTKTERIIKWQGGLRGIVNWKLLTETLQIYCTRFHRSSIYSGIPVARTLKGNKKTVRVSGISSYRGRLKYPIFQVNN